MYMRLSVRVRVFVCVRMCVCVFWGVFWLADIKDGVLMRRC